MSKLYDKYEKLKNEDIDCLYLFQCGNFYIALDSDAIILNEMFDMKLTKFSNACDKCGFPITALEKYENKLNKLNIKYKIIKNEVSEQSKINYIKKLIEVDNIEDLDKFRLIEIIKSIEKIIME